MDVGGADVIVIEKQTRTRIVAGEEESIEKSAETWDWRRAGRARPRLRSPRRNETEPEPARFRPPSPGTLALPEARTSTGQQNTAPPGRSAALSLMLAPLALVALVLRVIHPRKTPVRRN
ncbi:MAG: hypothetical protein WKF84_27640 [Pyrinomonadaceae bacterium]